MTWKQCLTRCNRNQKLLSCFKNTTIHFLSLFLFSLNYKSNFSMIYSLYYFIADCTDSSVVQSEGLSNIFLLLPLVLGSILIGNLTSLNRLNMTERKRERHLNLNRVLSGCCFHDSTNSF
jgi:hypothetical protein